MVGCSVRKLRSNSSASTTIISPSPEMALVWNLLTIPPITNVGSKFDSVRIAPNIDEVEVLPWVPAMATLVDLTFSNSPNISALRITEICCFIASTISGLSFGTADE